MLRLVEGNIVPAAGVLWGLYSSFDTSWIILAVPDILLEYFGAHNNFWVPSSANQPSNSG